MTYSDIVSHYESCLEKHGDTHLGVDWPRKQDAIKRYRVMLDLALPTSESFSLLDFGCGAAHLYDYIVNQEITSVKYSGLDISPKFIGLCMTKHPSVPFYCADILKNDPLPPPTDYIVMNGVFTERRSMSHESMIAYWQSILKRLFPLAKKGIAFNVMSKQVDWERPDLFHLSLDQMASFVTKHLSRHFIVRHDYGLYEYTVYVYHASLYSN